MTDRPQDQSPGDDDARRSAGFLRWLLVAVPLVLFLGSGWRGIDFGRHWDEGHRVLDLQSALNEGTLLPEEYNYPSMTFWLTVVALLPEAISRAGFSGETVELEGTIANYVPSDEFQIRCRLLFLSLSSLTILWVYATSLSWRRRPLEAFLAACLVAGSFEVAYHSRWVAPDAILTQFGALCLLACVRAQTRGGGRGWLGFAAVAAGLATGTKYTGGIFLLPVLLVTWQCSRSPGALLRALGLFAATFLFTSPGVVLEPAKFLEDLLFELRHYAEGHVGFTVGAGPDHLARNLRYLLANGPSKLPLISILFSLLGVVGLVGLWKDSRALALLLLLVPVIFVPYISSQRVMFVRNLLPLMPIAALLSARGAGLLWERWSAKGARLALAAVLTSGIVYDFGFELHAAETIRESTEEVLFAELDRYIAAHPEDIIQLSPNVKSGMKAAGHEPRPNVRLRPSEEAHYLATFRRELRVPGYWPSNDPDYLTAVIGPLSVNYDYYATWWQPHLVVMDKGRAHELARQHPPPKIEHIFEDLTPAPPAKAAE
jgi:4-amino-4-deoxy-L-arabinose transferase-like glycosyltransferase